MEDSVSEQDVTYVDEEAKQSLANIAHHVTLVTNQKTGIPDIQPEEEKDVGIDLDSPIAVEHERPPRGLAKLFPFLHKKTIHTTEASNFLKEEMGKIEEGGGEVVLK